MYQRLPNATKAGIFQFFFNVDIPLIDLVTNSGLVSVAIKYIWVRARHQKIAFDTHSLSLFVSRLSVVHSTISCSQ